MSVSLFVCLSGLVALVAAGEEAMAPSEMDPHHHVTTVCIQVHGAPGALCGPQVPIKPEAGRNANLQMAPAAEPSRAGQFQAAQFRDALTGGPPGDAVLQGFYENVPVYRMRSADEMQKVKAAPPCPDPNSRSSGPIVSVVQPPSYGLQSPLISSLGLAGLNPRPGSVVTVQQPPSGYYRAGEPGPASRTIPFAPFGVEQQQQPQMPQQMRGPQLGAARSQQYAAMRAAANAADCDDGPQFQPQMRAGGFTGQQEMRQAYRAQPPPQPYPSVRESQQSADFLAKQCAEQEMEIKKKSDEIAELKKQLDRLTSLTEKTTVEHKTVSVKSSSSIENQKEVAEDAKKDLQSAKKKK